MMKKILTITCLMLTSLYLFGQELTADDRLTITQSTKPYIGVYAFGYQGLPTPGFPQFQLNNYGGIPGTLAATADNSILGLFAFSGHNGSAKKTVGIIRVKTMDNFATNLSSRMDFLIGPNREQRMTILGDSGYVGIGTETPMNRLDVNGQIRMQAGAASGYVPVSDADGVMTWTDPTTFVTSPWIEVGDKVYRSTGSVGIGGSPIAKFHIRADGTTLNDGMRMTSSLGTGVDYYTYMNDSDDYIIRQDAVDALTLQSGTQNLGLGTLNPENELDIYRTGSAAIGVTANNAGSNAQLTLRTNTTVNDELFIRKYGVSATGTLSNGLSIANMSFVTAGADAGSLYTGTIGNHPVYLASSNEVAIFLDTDQDVGMNTENPTAQLHVLEEDGDNTYVIYGESSYEGNSSKYGVYGKSINNPGYGYGGYFRGGRRGLYASGEGATYGGTTYGVHGYASGTAGNRRGVYGQGYNPGGNTAYGVYGTATGSATTNYGVYGNASGAETNWAGYFNGNTYVRDTLTVDDRIFVNSDGTRNDRLVVMEASGGDAVYIRNPGNSTVNTSGSGIEVDAGYRGMDVDINDADLDGSHYGYYISNLTGGGELTGSQYGVYSYTSGARTAGGGNYSIYGQQGGTDGSGKNWAGYFSGSVRVTGTLDNTSDARLKRDVEDMEDALDIIKQLQPKTYEFKAEEYPHMALDTRPQLGFIAQDMEKVLPQLVRTAVHPEFVNDEGEDSDIPNSPSVDVKSINYIGIIPVLTQGIKELTTTVEEKEAVIEDFKTEVETVTKDNADLKSELAIIKKQMDVMAAMVNDKFNQMEEDMSSCCFNGTDGRTGSINTNVELNGTDIATLEQNSPNPFNEQTIIKYYIPSFAQKATMTITDIKGSPLKSVSLNETGLGTVTINANELSVGTYIYTLYVDGRQVESKQMVLVK